MLDTADAADVIDLVRQELGLADTKGRRFPRKATLLDLYSRSVNTQRPLSTVVDEHGAVVPRPRRAHRRPVPRLRGPQARPSACSTSTTCSSTGGRSAADERLGAVAGGRARPRLRRRVPGRQRPAGRHPPGAAAAATTGSPWSATTRRRCTASAAPAPATCSTSARRSPASRRSCSSELPLDASRSSTWPTRVGDDAPDGLPGPPAQPSTHPATGPSWCSCADEDAQVEAVCDQVLTHREAGIALQEQAVLVRAAHHSDLLELELAGRRIPYVKYGGLRYLEAAHVKDLVCLFRLADNPHDRLAWFRLLQLLDGVGPATGRQGADHPRRRARRQRGPRCCCAGRSPPSCSRPAPANRPTRSCAALRREDGEAIGSHADAPARRAGAARRARLRRRRRPLRRPRRAGGRGRRRRASPTSPPTSRSSRRAPPATSPVRR